MATRPCPSRSLLVGIVLLLALPRSYGQEKEEPYYFLSPRVPPQSVQPMRRADQNLALEGPVDRERYILGPHDQMVICIWGEVNESSVEIVSPDGQILVPPIGKVDAAGKSIAELERFLNRELGRYYKKVAVSVTLDRMRYFKVFVLGEVENPNIYSVQPVNRLSEAIEMAGGVTLNGALNRVLLTRSDGSADTLNLFRFAYTGAMAENPVLKCGDKIYVPPKENPVFIRGAVRGYQLFWDPFNRRPKAQDRSVERSFCYELVPGEGIGDLIRKTGGVSPDADLANAYIERYIGENGGGRKRQVLHLQLVLAPSGEVRDNSGVELRPGDTVVIPRIRDLVYVQGAVNYPGPIAYNPNYVAKDYIGLAGGISRMGRRSGWKLIGVDGVRRPVRQDSPVSRGETIFIPEKTAYALQEMISPLASIVSLSLSIIALMRVL